MVEQKELETQKTVTEAAPTTTVVVKKEEVKETHKQPFNNQRRNNQRRGGFNKNQPQSEYEERVINIARVTTVVKGGRRFSFSAYVVVGNKKGRVGFGHGKANEVQDAIKKAIKDAQNNLISVPIVNKSTIPHEINEKFLASKVLLKPAPKGKGIISSGTVRAVVELAGYTDIYTKTYGSRTKANIVQATINALKKLRTVEEIAKLRDLDVAKLQG
ncbi:30S ribosomal protein S5 [Candidatus Mycoplasma pogonae]